MLESWIEKVSDYELRGLRRSRSWAQNQYVYFYIRFEKPIRKWMVRNNGSVEAADSVSGKHIQAVVEFDLGDNKQLRTKIGISAVNTDGAKKNLEREIPHWKFETVRNQASRAWNKELSKMM